MITKKKENNQNYKNNPEKDTCDFSKNFYSIASIKQSCEDFKESAEIEIQEDNNIIKITITPKENIDNIKEEFSNYVLGMIVNNQDYPFTEQEK